LFHESTADTSPAKALEHNQAADLCGRILLEQRTPLNMYPANDSSSVLSTKHDVVVACHHSLEPGDKLLLHLARTSRPRL